MNKPYMTYNTESELYEVYDQDGNLLDKLSDGEEASRLLAVWSEPRGGE